MQMEVLYLHIGLSFLFEQHRAKFIKARAKRGPSLFEVSDHGGIGASPVGLAEVALDFGILG